MTSDIAPLCPDNIGCGRKVLATDLNSLRAILMATGVEGIVTSDAGILTVKPNVTGFDIISSIDRSVCFIRPLGVFAEASLRHFSNDIYASGARPLHCSASLGVGQCEDTLDELANLTRGLFCAASLMGIQVGKLHSFLDRDTTITASVTGLVQPIKQKKPLRSGGVFLLGRIGGLKAQYLAGIGHTEVSETVVRRALLRNNSSVADMVGRFDVFVSDVSGFGLLVGLDSLLAEHGLNAKVDWSVVPVVHSLVKEIEVSDLDGAKEYQSTRISAIGCDAVARISEFNGPMMCLVASHDEVRFIDTAAAAGIELVVQLGTWSH